MVTNFSQVKLFYLVIFYHSIDVLSSWISVLINLSDKQGTVHLNDVYDILPEYESKQLTDTLENNWFNEIMNWQHSNEGCYGNDTNHVNNKREEMQMFHQCLSHRTSVAIAALSQILRYLLSRDI